MRLSHWLASTATLARRATIGAIVLLLQFTGATRASNAVISIDTSRPGPSISPQLYGIFLEEINHGVDGGLYAELIRNRGFEDSRPPEGYTFRNGRWRDERGFDSGFSRYGYTTNGVPFWSFIQSGNARGSINLETTGGITEQSAYCVRLDIEDIGNGSVGIANEGFFGLGLKQGERYQLSLYARGGDGFSGPLSVQLLDSAGAACSDEVTVENIGSSWSRFNRTLVASKTEPKAAW